ncbi:DUF7344 domain-containing protein [Haladaptatus sp. DFWS20]|uniref:DUF7344 domain-containing protein n=1 Tax=Haladaptatus sp. DFWS20 TaxID=3403467 RepID=UPI003EC07AA4
MAKRHNPPNDNDPDHTQTIPPVRPGLDKVFRAVSHPERRRALRYLKRADEPQAIDDIAAAVFAETVQGSPTDRQHLSVALTHHHLPLLADVRLVERTSRGFVASTEATPDIVHVLDVAADYFD